MNSLDEKVWQHQSPKERENSIQTLKNVGMLTQDSTVDELKATSGEQFALGQAQLAAGAMDRSERFAVGNTSINAVRDVMTGAARIESNSGNSFSDGDQVNHNYGLNVKNPVQYAGHETGAFNTTNMGMSDASIVDSVSGAAATGLMVYGAGAVGYKTVDYASGGKLKEVVNAGKHKVKGDVSGVDSEGKKVYSSQDKWESLEKEGLATKNIDGKWESSLNKNELKEKFDNQKSLSAGSVKKSQATIDKNPNTNMPINHSIDSPSSSDMGNYNIETSKPNVNSVKTPLGEVFSGGNTIKANTDAKKVLANTSDGDLGKLVIAEQAKSAKMAAL